MARRFNTVSMSFQRYWGANLGQARQVAGGKKWTFSKAASKELANLINTMYIKRRSFNHWAIFMMVEKNIVMAAGESRTKVFRKTWSRRHVRDKA
jgi:hypothetical protein